MLKMFLSRFRELLITGNTRKLHHTKSKYLQNYVTPSNQKSQNQIDTHTEPTYSLLCLCQYFFIHFDTDVDEIRTEKFFFPNKKYINFTCKIDTGYGQQFLN